MKKAVVLSAVLMLVSSSSFAATPTTFTSKHSCEFKTHGACVQEGSNWVAAPTTSSNVKPTTPTTPPTTTATTTTTAPTPPTPPTPPAAANQQAPSSGKGWWPFSGNTSSAESSSAPTHQSAPNKPVDPRAVAKGKVYGAQGDCQGQTGGNCVATNCATHVGGVCEGNHGTVWTYAR